MVTWEARREDIELGSTTSGNQESMSRDHDKAEGERSWCRLSAALEIGPDEKAASVGK